MKARLQPILRWRACRLSALAALAESPQAPTVPPESETVQAVACYDNRVSFDLRGEFPEEVKTAVRNLAEAFADHDQF